MAEGLFPDLTWHHVGVSVADIDTAIAYYGEVFGFELEFRKYIAPIDTHLAFIRRGDFRMEIFQKGGAAPVPEHRKRPNTDLAEQGTKHPCFAVGDCQRALELMFKRADTAIIGIVRQPGAPMVVEENPCLSADDLRPPAAAFFCRDPNDLIIEIVRAADFAA